MKTMKAIRFFVMGVAMGMVTSLCAFNQTAHAAQRGKIVVDTAFVYEYPQSKSKVIDQVLKDEVVAVGNAPIEGFYKARTSKGNIGWISGNDVLVSPPEGAAPPTAAPQNTEPTEERPSRVVEKSSAKKKNAESASEHSRIILGGGLQSLSFSGVPAEFNAAKMNRGWDGLVEFQFELSELFFWAIRAEYLMGNSGAVDMGGGITQTTTLRSMPLQGGIVFSPLSSSTFRLGVGAYLGIDPLAKLKVVQESTVTTDEVNYDSVDPCGALALQMKVGIGEHSGIFFEGAYHYQQTTDFPVSTALANSVAAFKANYSGMVFHLGMEFRI